MVTRLRQQQMRRIAQRRRRCLAWCEVAQNGNENAGLTNLGQLRDYVLPLRTKLGSNSSDRTQTEYIS